MVVGGVVQLWPYTQSPPVRDRADRTRSKVDGYLSPTKGAWTGVVRAAEGSLEPAAEEAAFEKGLWWQSQYGMFGPRKASGGLEQRKKEGHSKRQPCQPNVCAPALRQCSHTHDPQGEGIG